ncbi:MAG: aldo/keto reductase, partial [Calditrichaeota bacterium]
MRYRSLHKVDLAFPPIIFGVSSLGNLYQELPYSTKLEILREMFSNIDGCVALDAAGKYGAGLALEVIGWGMTELG